MADIRPLKKGQKVETTPTVNSELVVMLEELLEKAKTGQIYSAAVIYEADDCTAYDQTGIDDPYRFVGHLEMLKNWVLSEADADEEE